MSGLFGFNQADAKSQQQIADATPEEFRGLRPDLKRIFERLLSEGRSDDLLAGIPQSPQSQAGYSAPLTEAEAQQLASIQAQTGPGTERSALLDKTLSGAVLDSANPHLQSAIAAAQRPVLESYEELLGRVLPGQFTRAGHRVQPGQSSPFDRAAAVESRGLASALGDISTNMSFANYEAERQRQQQAVTFSQAELDTSLKALQAQALPRLIQQYGIDQGLEEFKARSNQLLQLLSLLSGGMLSQSQVVGETKNESFGFDIGSGSKK